MPVLVTVEFDNGVSATICNEEFAGETNYYEPWLLSIDNISFSLEYQYGGARVTEWGGIKISHRLFENTNYMWPPPLSVTLSVKYTSSTEATAVTFVEGAIGHFSDMDEHGVMFDIYLDETEGALLLEKTSDLDGACTTDYNGDNVVVPRAVGTVEYQQPLRLEDYVTQSGDTGYPGTYPVYHNGYMQGTKHTDWHVFDDNVDINTNIVVGSSSTSGTNTFYTLYTAVGEISVSGNGTFDAGDSIDAAIDDLLTARMGAVTIVNTYSRSGDAKIGHWASSQEPLIDYVSKLCASHAHIFTVYQTSSFTAYVVAIEQVFTSTTSAYSDSYILPVGHSANDGPVSAVKATWSGREAVTEGGRTFIKDIPKEAEVSHSVFWSGTTDDTGTNKLIQSSPYAYFEKRPGYLGSSNPGSDMLRPGMYVKNITDATETLVVAVDQDWQLSITDDIFISGEDYEIGYKFKHGRQISITAYSIDKTVIETNLKYIINWMHSRQIDMAIPLESAFGIDVFGIDGRYLIEERRYARDTYYNHNKIIGITYDFENEKATYRIVGMVYEEDPQ